MGVRGLISDYREYLLFQRKRRHKRDAELKKFQDSRRVNIFSKVSLTDEQKYQIDSLYLANYGEKIPYIWHRHFTAFTGNFDVNYFPELLYIPEFERYENYNRAYSQVMEDKNMLPVFAKAVGVQMPETVLSCTGGLLKCPLGGGRSLSVRESIEYLRNVGEVFIKPTVGTCSGAGCFVADFKNGIEQRTGRNAEDIISKLGSDFVVQERLACSDDIRKIYTGSVNTFRVITYRWRDNFFHCPVIMRIGRNGNYLDNAHAGGMFIALDDDGTMHEKAFTEFKEVYTSHPDSGLEFNGYQVKGLPKVVAAAIRMHESIPQIGSVNWDFTLDVHDNPVLIEANVNGGSIWMAEMSHGKGVFGDRTAEILRWLRLMNKTPWSKQKQYLFGHGVE